MTMAGQQEDKDMYDDVVIPAHLRAQARRDGKGSVPSSTDDPYSSTRWIFARKRDSVRPIHPRSLYASMLRATDRRRGTTDSLTLINYGPVERTLRTWLAKLNWRRWWR